MKPIYLDHNATTPVLPEVVDAMLPYLREHFGNPSSGHLYGQRARDAIAVARQQVASLIGAQEEQIIFTSGGTEASNLAIRGVAETIVSRRHIVTTAIEHPATVQPCQYLQERGWRITWLGVDSAGRARLDEAQSITEETALLTVMHSNNETGVLQPVKELAQKAKAVGALVHTDAAQSLGKVAVDVDDMQVDLLSVAGHKVYAPKGVGALYVRRGTQVAPVLVGAGHEGGMRPGTENVASIVGLGAACVAAQRDLSEAAAAMLKLRERLWSRLREGVPELALNGHESLRLPNTLNVRFPHVSGNAVLAGAPEVAASTGSACHEGHDVPSAVMVAMGIASDQALGSVRLTLGRSTTEGDIERAAGSLVSSWRALRAGS